MLFDMVKNQYAPLNAMPALQVSTFDYVLPKTKIALDAIEPRDASKLLCWENGHIADHVFSELPQCLSRGDLLIANDTKVISARMQGFTDSGHAIEIFLLNPLNDNWTQWEVMVGNKRKFKLGMKAYVGGIGANEIKSSKPFDRLYLTWIDRSENHIEFILPNPLFTMADAIAHFGKIPLPPYIDRPIMDSDSHRYQTVFAKTMGAVAAPTAALHFTQSLRIKLQDRGVNFSFLTLHVGAGTFKPMTANTADKHIMHGERFEIGADLLDRVMHQLLADGGRVVAIGTTSMRVLESLYYLGIKAMRGQDPGILESAEPYKADAFTVKGKTIDTLEALEYLREYCLLQGGVLCGYTYIFIVEGFQFRICDGLITNFHQPKSTLLMLVSAFVGEEWRNIYRHALEKGYHFLSYGDGSLLWKEKIKA